MNNILSRWKAGLARTSKATFGQFATIFGATDINDDTWEKLESLLIHADVGVETTITILDKLEDRIDREGIIRESDLNLLLREELRCHLDVPPTVQFTEKPFIILVVGVNGSGKTTTIAKLGKRFADQGKQVILGAADTFRAAGVDQLEIWAERVKLPVISGQLGGDAGAVAYDTVQAAIARKADLAIIDTAGRLHTRYNLMEELKKVYRVLGKALPGAPHSVWLVMDATTGQNALQQARAFKEAVHITGIILAKLDSSARGGMVLAIQRELGIPILFAGLGEQLDDLQPFDADLFISGLVQE